MSDLDWVARCLQGCLMCVVSCVLREVNARMLEEEVEPLLPDSGRFAINQLLFVDDTALVADSEGKLRKLVSEFG